MAYFETARHRFDRGGCRLRVNLVPHREDIRPRPNGHSYHSLVITFEVHLESRKEQPARRNQPLPSEESRKSFLEELVF